MLIFEHQFGGQPYFKDFKIGFVLLSVSIPGLGLLCPLQSSKCLLHSSCQSGLILQHLTDNRHWKLQQHTCNTLTVLETLVLCCHLKICWYLKKKAQSYLLFRHTHTHELHICVCTRIHHACNCSPVSFPAVSLCFG